MGQRFAELNGYEISGCAVIDKNLVSFWGQQWPVSDPLEPRPTAVFFYYDDEPAADQWAHSGVADATGIHGCVAYQPVRQWVYVLDDAEVYVVGGGADDFERKITTRKNAFFTNVKSIKSGPAMAVGPRRKVFVREGPGRWIQLDTGLFPQGENTALDDAGFVDIDGFSLSELYACGGHGDLWRYHQAAWDRIDIGTNAVLTKICCAGDGLVYIATNRRELIVGRDHTWHVVQQALTTQVFESLVDYRGRLLVSTEGEIYEIAQGQFVPASLPGMPAMKCKAHLAASNDVLVVAGKDEAVMFDGASWTTILAPGP